MKEDGAERTETAETLAQYACDIRFLIKMKSGWTTRYPDQWVLVHREEMAGKGDTIEEATSQASTRGIAPENCAQAFLSTQNHRTILRISRNGSSPGQTREESLSQST